MTRLITTLVLALGAFTLSAAADPARAGNFNCAVVYDEFESLMNRRFLVEPADFVATLPGRISKEQFEGNANAGFHLYPSRKGMGIGIVKTNQNTYAKFLFHWSQPMVDGSFHLIIDEVVRYGRVADGYAPRRSGPFRLKPGMAIDLDSGSYILEQGNLAMEDPDDTDLESGDLKYEAGIEGGERVLKSVNAAQVQFPEETMCQSRAD